jgi:sulfite reductase (NADPH) flavoprotein alpha-component
MIASGFTETSAFHHAQRPFGAQCVRLFVQPAASQRLTLPKDPATPIIMVGAGGEGIIPFRTFLEQRRAVRATGENWLLVGDRRRSAAREIFHRDAILDYVRDGTLTRLDAALTCDPEERDAVQHRLFENARGLWAWIDLGASVYVCGEPVQVADVETTLAQLIAEQGHMSDEHAIAYVTELAIGGRYQRCLN